MNESFVPDDRDYDGIDRLKGEISRDRNRHDGYKIACATKPEANWIRSRLLAWRPDLAGRLVFSWMRWRGTYD